MTLKYTRIILTNSTSDTARKQQAEEAGSRGEKLKEDMERKGQEEMEALAENTAKVKAELEASREMEVWQAESFLSVQWWCWVSSDCSFKRKCMREIEYDKEILEIMI